MLIENLSEEEREYLMSSLETALKRFDVYIGFMEKAHSILRARGEFGFIIPYPFLNQNYAERLRSLLLEKSLIQKIVNLRDYKIFPEATIKNILFLFRKCDQGSIVAKHNVEILNPKTDPATINKIEADTLYTEQSIFQNLPEKMIRLEVSGQVQKMYKKIISCSMNFGEIIAASWGARGVPISKFHLDKKINDFCQKMLKGENIDRYSGEYSEKWLLYDPSKLYRPSMKDFFEKRKIIISKVTGSRGLIAYLDDKKYYTDDSLICCILKYELSQVDNKILGIHKIYVEPKQIELSRKYNLTFLLALICSSVVNFYFNLILGYELNVYPESIEQLPVRRINFITTEDKRKEFLEKEKMLYERCMEKGDDTYVIGFIEDNLSAKPERSDVVHDLLAFLAEQMIDMNKEKQKEIKGFLTWLEGYLGAKIDDLTNKTRIKSYYELSWEDLLEVLESNRRRIDKVDITRREPQEKIKKEFEDSLSKLNPLLNQIQATDNLIDQIVYKLYGLTEEEIKIVEEQVKRV